MIKCLIYSRYQKHYKRGNRDHLQTNGGSMRMGKQCG